MLMLSSEVGGFLEAEGSLGSHWFLRPGGHYPPPHGAPPTLWPSMGKSHLGCGKLWDLCFFPKESFPTPPRGSKCYLEVLIPFIFQSLSTSHLFAFATLCWLTSHRNVLR